MIPLAAIAEAARVLAIAAPLLTEALRAIGCAIEGCSDPLAPADIPTGEAGLDARHRAIMKGAGFDAAPRHARAEKLAEGVVVIRRRPA